MNGAATPPRPSLATRSRPLVLAWLALLALMSTSLFTSYLHLGRFNAIAGLGIAVIKAFVVGWWFMRLRAASATTRVAPLIAIFTLTILVTLSGIDYLTRSDDPSAVQPPLQISPLLSNRVP